MRAGKGSNEPFSNPVDFMKLHVYKKFMNSDFFFFILWVIT